MQVTLKNARAVMVGLGFRLAKNYDAAKLTAKLNALPDIVDDTTTTGKVKLDAYIKKLVKATGKIVVADEESVSEETNEEPIEKGTKMAKKKVTKKTTKKTTTPKQATSTGTGVDEFGSRIGTLANKVNACLSTTPKKMADIQKEAGLTTTFYNHMKKLIEAGHVAKVDDGYVLTKGGSKASASTPKKATSKKPATNKVAKKKAKKA